MTDSRGTLLYAYFPVPANPMSVAMLLLLLVVTFVLGPLAVAPFGLWPLGGLCFAPLLALILLMVATKPSPTYVHEGGIEISLPLWQRLLGTPGYVPWDEVRDVYPASYEVAGSFLSPFASSAGTLVHRGLGIETKDGRRRLVRFTPGAIKAFRAESQGFLEAMAVIRDRFARNGVPMVTTAKPLTDAEVLRMQEKAAEPLVSISAVFLAFFLPPTIVAAAIAAASFAGVPLSTPIVVASVIAGLAPPVFSMVQTLRRSEQRNAILSELAKYQESARERSAPTEEP